MGHTHVKGRPSGSRERLRRMRLVLLLILLPFLAATVVGVVLLWPEPYSPPEGFEDPFARPGVEFQSAPVVGVLPVPCPEEGVTDEARTCADLVVRLADGSETTLEVAPSVIETGLGVGSRVHVVYLPGGDGRPDTYSFVEVDRGLSLGALAAVFALLVVAVARLRGLAAIAGLFIAFAVLRQFMLPALLAGESAIPVAVVGSALIMFVALYVAHGVSMRTTTAVLGTMFGLGATALLGWLMTDLAFLTGAGGDDQLLLGALAPDVQLRGVLLAGLVLAGLGVLNDVTVTQASSVWELHEAHPSMGTRRLFTSAMRIGRDHIASSVYTLVFAYAGAALPILLLIAVYERPLLDVVSTEAIAEEVVSTLVGATGLVLAVPLTTLLGALVITAATRPTRGERSASAAVSAGRAFAERPGPAHR
jgi:uncharacterized membrane protein